MNQQMLLAAIAANPNDDEPRLVLADLLEENGDPRGELIQLQCRLARPLPPDEAAPLAVREREVLKLVLADLDALELGATFAFDRGFVSSMTGQFPAATTRAAELLVLAPLLQRLALTVHGQLDRVQLARPNSHLILSAARELNIRGRKAGNTRGFRGPIADLHGLAAVPFVQLQSLSLSTLRPRLAGLVALLRSPHLDTLDSLTLSLRMPEAELAQVMPAIDALRARRPNLDVTI